MLGESDTRVSARSNKPLLSDSWRHDRSSSSVGDHEDKSCSIDYSLALIGWFARIEQQFMMLTANDAKSTCEIRINL